MCWRRDEIIKNLLYFALFVSPIGAQWMTLQLPWGMLSLFRGVIFLAFMIFAFTLLTGEKFVLFYKRNKYSVVFMVVWWMYALCTSLWMVEPVNWGRNIYCMSVGIICMVLCINSMKCREDIVGAFVMFQWGIVIQMLIGWYEVFTKNYYFTNPDYVIRYARGIYGFPVAMQYNINNFATLMFVGLFISAICYHFPKSNWLKFVYTMCFVSEIILIGLIQCRSVYLACFISMIFCGLKYKVWRRSSCMFVIGIMGMVGLFCLGMNENLRGILCALIGFDFETYESDLVRLNMLLNGLDFLSDTYGLGVGAGQIEEWITRWAVYYHAHITNMHNWWGEILVAFGIPIFVGYCVFYWRLFRDMWNADREFMGTFLGFCLTGLTFALVSGSTFFTSEMLWAFWAIVIAYQGILGDNEKN